MTTAKILLLIFGAALALGLSAFTYLEREPAGRGRAFLIALRTTTLILLLLLLLDPRLPGAQRRTGGTRFVVDASLSMQLGNAWQRALTEAAGAVGPVLLFGSAARAVPPDSLARLRPTDGASQLLPALQSAAEANAERVIVVTDGAIDDAPAVTRWLPTLNLDLTVRNVGGPSIPNRALRDVEAPAWAEAAKPITFGIQRQSTAPVAGDAVVVRQDGREIARTAGDSVSFIASGPPEGGLVRYDVAFAAADSIPDDDVRSVYVFIGEQPAGVAIVSFDPDWEPRFLHPVLENALGLPVRSFLRLSGAYVRVGSGLAAGTRVPERDVLRAVNEADLLVLHGMTAAAPQWAQQAARSARSLFVFPGEGGTRVPIQTSGAVAADWYVSPDVPASPIAALLADIDASAIPPLNSLQTATAPEQAWAPLLGGRTRTGGSAPLVLAAEIEDRRWAVALGRGYWQWAFRGGAARDAYTRLWGALAGWVTQERAQVAGASVRPVARAVARAEPIRWVAPGIAADSFVLTMGEAAGNKTRAVLPAQNADTVVSAAGEPGHYTYDIRALRNGSEVARASGPLTIESYSPEFMRRVVDIEELKNAPRQLAQQARTAGRALHTYSWLYVLLVALLCAEWVLRRRWGLR
ncbi:MAG: hypothetical protein ACT443_12835 [Gemmatimonadota bacterium]